MGSTIEITEARKTLNSIDERLRNDPVIIITKHSKKAFAVVDLSYLATMLHAIDMLSNPDQLRDLRRYLTADI
jgi:PHD/YefM family antitoxin component YafN of YafNO toxin-antitoxin module